MARRPKDHYYDVDHPYLERAPLEYLFCRVGHRHLLRFIGPYRPSNDMLEHYGTVVQVWEWRCDNCHTVRVDYLDGDGFVVHQDYDRSLCEDYLMTKEERAKGARIPANVYRQSIRSEVREYASRESLHRASER